MAEDTLQSLREWCPDLVPEARPAPMVEPIPSRRWTRLGFAYMALGAVALWYAQDADQFSWWAHGTWCVAGFVLALPALWSALRGGFAVVLTDHRLILLAAFCLYFLFGAALPAFGPDQQVFISMSLYPSDPGSVLRVDAINGLGFGVALVMSAFTRGLWLERVAAKVAGNAARLPYNLVAGAFLGVGIGATAYRISVDFGFQSGVVSGLVRNLAQLSLVAIFMGVSSRGSHERVLRWLAVILAGVLALVGAMQFMKSEALFPLVALTGGLALRFGSLRVLPIGLVMLTTLYMLLGNVVNYGRYSVNTASGPSTLGEHWAFLKDGWKFSGDLYSGSDYPYWGRLCYVPTQVASVDFYDEGRGGSGLQMMWWVFVPRFLAPNKPQMTAMFGELNEKITGSDQSANSPGVFVSGYYHGGWWGVLLASAVCGWVVIQTSAIARAIHTQQAVLMLPFSLLGMFIAFRIDGDFIPDYLGVFMFILYPLVAAALFLPWPAKSQQRQSDLSEGT